MSIFAVEQLYKTYGEKTLFDHIDFSVSEKQRIGLIGVNGTGKSTLLKTIAGIETAEEGSFSHANDFRIEYLTQQPDLHEGLTVLEQIYYGDSPLMNVLRQYEETLSILENDPENEKKQARLIDIQQQMDRMNAWDASATAKTILTKLGITEFSKPVDQLSGGQKKRVAIAKALIHPADLLLLDEPTNHLDNETIEWLEKYLSQYNGALMLVTHDRYFLNRVANQIFELDEGKLYEYEGNYETFLEKKAEREENAIASEQKRQNLLRRELAWLRRGAKARTTKQKARIQRVDEIQERKGPTVKEDIDIAIGTSRLGKKVIEINNITKSVGQNVLVDDFSYLVVPGDRIGIIGRNGSGKTTLLNMLAGRLQPDSGSIEVGETVKVGYYTQDHQEMDGNLRVIDYIKEKAEAIKTIDGQIITAAQMLERFLFPRHVQWSYIRKLSGGERKRLYLLRTLMGEPNVLFLDEPTNDLDTQTLAVLEDYLDQFPGVVITVSHDRYFLDRIVDLLLCFEGNGVIQRYTGNYSEYLEKKQTEENTTPKSSGAASSAIKTAPKKEKRKKLSYKEQQEWDGMEDRIDSLENRLKMISEEIASAGSDIGKVQPLFKEQQELEEELEQSMERWTELSIMIEEIENQ